MAHIAFFNYPAHSHVNPTLSIVSELIGRGHRVTYVVAEQFAQGVKETGATVLSYDSLAPESWGTVAIPANVTGDDVAKAALAHLSEALRALETAEPVLASDRPDVLVYDAFGYAGGRILARKWGVPSVLSCTTFVANETFSPYAKQSRRAPVIDPQHPALIEYGEKLTAALDAHGLGNVSIEEFSVGAEQKNLVYLPKTFQIGADTFDDRFVFVGPCLGGREFQGRWQPPAGADPVLLVTMGSFAYENQLGFFQQCVEAFADLPRHLVLAVGGLVDPAHLQPLPANVEVHAWLPQLPVLAHANGFISHAGMGSTMESLAFGIPPVVIPRTAEQDLVADQIVGLGVGRRLESVDVTAESLRAVIVDVSSDTTTWTRAADLANDIRRAGGAARAADEIETLFGEL
ncbi:macrolide family glycosyltransferase [Actinocrispum wychmicini]|uniref:MGT family glycosyltransferase n=1 Tax=Actinocrispum wychmicini TaxID=1213861 RepID=A0A4R2JM12_9PSEU|nr:macrolide family glycosyltransferase [Actinocrispum wychmicini]TCO59917.1 MGT family glycosyltransferase [Actinocrispum wychmicini]